MPHLTASARSRSAWQTPRMSDITTADVRAELEAWLEENWDPDLTVLQWWQRLYEDRWSSPAMPVEAGWAAVVMSNGVINLCADKE